MNGVYVNMGGSYNVSHAYFVRSAIRNRWVTVVHESDTLGFRLCEWCKGGRLIL